MKALPLLGALIVALGACRNPSEEGATEASAPRVHGPGAQVTGTVLDARTGKPIAGARVLGPGGLETKSDAQGRFLLKGLAPGTTGDLVGTTDSGLAGKNRLRSLAGGALEVVLYLR